MAVILGDIPDEHRTPTVRQLMADAVAIGDTHWAGDLVGLVRAWFARPPEGAVACRRCGHPATRLCSLCRACVELEGAT